MFWLKLGICESLLPRMLVPSGVLASVSGGHVCSRLPHLLLERWIAECAYSRVVGPSSKVVFMHAAGRERRGGEQGGRSCRLKGARPVLPSWGLSSLAPAVEVQGRRVGRLPAPEKCDGHRSGDGPPQAFSPGGITTWLTACPLTGPS